PEIRKWTKNPRKPGHGFPAGHASGGFALMGLCVFGRTRRGITLGVAAGLSLGWILGSYQMLNGNHYLSHTVVTNLLAGILVLFWIGIMLRGGGTKRVNERR
ncbi:MAG: membrane-associated PAP2 superfamily phosphatase, partial [Pseudoalteromonas tetraodonis]